MADTEAAALRDALAAVAEALDVPAGQAQERSDRAIMARSAIKYMLMPGADIGTHIRGLRERIAERPAPGA